MAYDKARKDEIDAMTVSELVHTMLVEFDPDYRRSDDGGPGEPWRQGNAYLWAQSRLDELLPIAKAGE